MSSNNIEIESKVLLTKSEAENISKKLNFPETEIVHINYYLDSEDRLLKKYDMICRVRIVDGVARLTMKAPLSEGLLEKNQALTEKEKDALVEHGIFPRGEISDFLDTLHIDPLKLQVLANLTSHRKMLEYHGTTLDLSKNVYGDKTDYELECDSDSAHKSESTLREICDEFDIKFKLNVVSKENRAINAALSKK
jgi:uncharacterized protein YjbK